MESFEAAWIDLLKNNRAWAQKQEEADSEYFARLAASQAPPFLYIGCADSRIPVTTFTKSGPGQIFIHRNIANQVSMTDMSFLAVLEYAVVHLKVSHIIISGHYNCGGVKAAMAGQIDGIIGNWVQPIHRLYLKSSEEVNKLPEAERANRMSEINVIRQVKNLLVTKVMETVLNNPDIPSPTIHGVVIDLSTGHLNELEIPFDDWKAKSLLPKDFDNNGYVVGDSYRK